MASDERSDDVTIPSTVPTFGKAVLLISGITSYGLSIGLPISLSVMFLHWQDSFGSSRAQTAAVHGTCAGTLLAAGVIPGYLMSRFGARSTVLLGTFFASVGLFLSAFATSIEYLVVTTGLLTGFGFCLMQLPCMPCVMFPFTKYRGVILSTISASCGVTGLVLPYLVDALVNAFTWRGSFFLMSGFALNNGVLALIMTSTVSRLKPPKQLQNVSEQESHCHKDRAIGDVIDNADENELLKADTHLGEDKNAFLSYEIEIRPENGENSDFQLFSSKTSTENFKTAEKSLVSVGRNVKSKEAELERKGWKFGFLLNPVAISFYVVVALALGSYFSFFILQMDFARTHLKAGDSVGLLCIITMVISGLFGRLLSGPINLLPHCHSVLIMAASGVMSSSGMLILALVTQTEAVLTLLALTGLGLGAMLGIHPKVILDLKVFSGSYSLALGLACTSEGVFEILIPILVGHAVDVTGSYFLPLMVMGIISIAVVSAFFIGWRITERRARGGSSEQ